MGSLRRIPFTKILEVLECLDILDDEFWILVEVIEQIDTAFVLEANRDDPTAPPPSPGAGGPAGKGGLVGR
jgi:hypothetical protein